MSAEEEQLSPRDIQRSSENSKVSETLEFCNPTPLSRCTHPAARLCPFDFCQHCLFVYHRNVARCFLHQDAVGGTPLYRRRQILALEQRSQHARGEGISATRPVGDRDVLPQRRFVHFAFDRVV